MYGRLNSEKEERKFTCLMTYSVIADGSYEKLKRLSKDRRRQSGDLKPAEKQNTAEDGAENLKCQLPQPGR